MTTTGALIFSNPSHAVKNSAILVCLKSVTEWASLSRLPSSTSISSTNSTLGDSFFANENTAFCDEYYTLNFPAFLICSFKYLMWRIKN